MQIGEDVPRTNIVRSFWLFSQQSDQFREMCWKQFHLVKLRPFKGFHSAAIHLCGCSIPHPTQSTYITLMVWLHATKKVLLELHCVTQRRCVTTIGSTQRKRGELSDASWCFSLSRFLVPGESLVSQDLGTSWTLLLLSTQCTAIYKDLGTAD